MLPGNTTALSGQSGPNDGYVVLLMHGDGPNNSLVIYDYSFKQHGAATLFGNAKVSTGQPKPGFGGASYFSTGAGYCTWPDSPDWDLGTGDFTIDWWEWRTALGWAALSRAGNGTPMAFMLSHYVAGNSTIYMSSNGVSWDIAAARSMGAQTLNQWIHFAVVRQGTTFRTFRNGNQIDTWTSALALFNQSTPIFIGVGLVGSQYYNGYIEELRISKGIARWTAAFTPPTIPYYPNPSIVIPPVPTTKILLHFDGTAGSNVPTVDSASGVDGNGIHVWTNSAIQTPGKFGTGYMAADVLTSDGTTHTDFNVGAGAFTVDAWVKTPGGDISNTHSIAAYGDVLENHLSYALYVEADTRNLKFIASNDGITDIVNLNAGSIATLITDANWHHIAVTRSGNDWRLFLDGIQKVVQTVSGTLLSSPAGAWYAGSFGGGGGDGGSWMGPIDEVRLVVGQALWTANFTPPTSAGGVTTPPGGGGGG